MVETKKDNTEDKILDAAQTVFVKKGMDGSRMQEIANEAGINKALLHYYFRTKQKLFEAIFTKLFKQIFPNLEMLVNNELPIKIRLESFIDNYIDILLNHPYLPGFMLKEINRDPQFLASVFKSQKANPTVIIEMFEKEMEAGTIRRMAPQDLMINILSLSIFPFAAKPLMNLIFFNNDKKAYNRFLEERKNTIKEFVLSAVLTPVKN